MQRPYEEELEHEQIDGIYASAANERLFVVSKQNGGKADALNAAINLSRAPIVCAIDGDSILEPDALIRAAQPFIDAPRRTVGVGGTIRIANGSRIEAGRVVETMLPRRLLPLIQVVEYLRAFLMARLAWSQMNSLMLVSGAFGVFRRAEVVAIGGYRRDTVGEDLELVVRLHRHMIDTGQDYRIVFIPEPVCWTEAPELLSVLGRQRSRWQRGALETFAAHRDMLFNRRYGLVGSLGFGHLLIVDVIGPVTEVLGYLLIPLFWALGLLSVDYLLAFTAIVFTYGVFVSVCSLILEELELRRFPRASDLAILALVAVVENFGYRQLTNLWRLRGYWQYFREDRSWGDMRRVGLARADES